MNVPVIGFIGFGEAAYLISGGLLDEGISQIFAFDVLALDHEKGRPIQERAKELGVELAPSLQQLIEKSDVIFCATSAKVAEKIAKEAADYLKPQQIYVDINAASPMVKERIAKRMEEAHIPFVDGAVMAPVPGKKHKVPIFISGGGAKAFKEMLTPYGMNLTFINEKAGSSSAIKMIRSIFMKGFSMLLLETLEASHRYGVTDLIMESLDESITRKPLEETANMLITRTAVHAERRVSEMGDVIDTLKFLDADSTMAKAVQAKLQRIVDLKMKEYLHSEVPGHYEKVLQALEELNS